MAGMSISRKISIMSRYNKCVFFYVAAIALLSVGGLAYVYAVPPISMKIDRNGVPHFTPQVINPETGEAIDIGELVKHYRGD